MNSHVLCDGLTCTFTGPVPSEADWGTGDRRLVRPIAIHGCLQLTRHTWFRRIHREFRRAACVQLYSCTLVAGVREVQSWPAHCCRTIMYGVERDSSRDRIGRCSCRRIIVNYSVPDWLPVNQMIISCGQPGRRTGWIAARTRFTRLTSPPRLPHRLHVTHRPPDRQNSSESGGRRERPGGPRKVLTSRDSSQRRLLGHPNAKSLSRMGFDSFGA